MAIGTVVAGTAVSQDRQFERSGLQQGFTERDGLLARPFRTKFKQLL
jgi:hypothetical protein